MSRGWPVWDPATSPDGSPMDFRSSSLPSAFPLFARRLSFQGGWGQGGRGPSLLGAQQWEENQEARPYQDGVGLGLKTKATSCTPSAMPQTAVGRPAFGVLATRKASVANPAGASCPQGFFGQPRANPRQLPWDHGPGAVWHTLFRCLHPRKRSQSLGIPEHGWGVPPLPGPALCPFSTSSLPSWMGRGLLRASSGERTPASCCGQRLGPGHCLEHPPPQVRFPGTRVQPGPQASPLFHRTPPSLGIGAAQRD